jgi:PAT family beta-lactamase induction signal transducer AmpG
MPDESPKLKRTNPWSWVPTLYFAEGIPYTVVTVLSVVMYKMLGISNTKIAFYTSLLNLPWALKPIWGPIVDNLKTKRWWVLTMQFIMGILFACIALTIPTDHFFQVSIALLWLVAFMSATHDVAADGFYMIGLDEGDQALYNGIRSAFYRIAMLMGQGVFVIFISILINASGMDKVTIEVNAVPAENKIKSIQVKPEDIQPKPGDIYLISVPEELNIPMKPMKREYVDSVLMVVREWNVDQGHTETDDTESTKKSSQPEPIRKVHTNRLEKWLRKTFGAAKKVRADYTGNVGVVQFYLSRPPEKGEDVVVTFGQDKGDPSIRLVEGMRFEFDQCNWNKPAKAVIQLDKKLQQSSTAYFDAESGNIRLSWMVLFLCISVMFTVFWIIHRFTLEKIEKERIERSVTEAIKDFFSTFSTFFRKKGIGLSIIFLLIFRLGESQLVKLSAPFMLDTREVGGLGLTAGQYGLTYGTIGLLFLLSGGILGGMAVSKVGLKKMIWWFAIMINVPNAAYI